MPDAMLSFKLGPVQPFIEAARTLRDLWSGSYLLSWLTAHAMKPFFDNGKLKHGVQFISPDVNLDENALLRAVILGTQRDTKSTIACLPHTFAVQFDANKADQLKTEVLKTVKDEWLNIAKIVKGKLAKVLREQEPHWQGQIDSYFEFTCIVLKLDEAGADVLEKLNVKLDDSQDSANTLWGRQWNLQQALLDLTRGVRHVPPYNANQQAERFPVKCSLLGSFEQMGPAELRDSKAFWEKAVEATKKGFDGTRLQSSDKLCAVSLVKRFAWPVYWSDKLGLNPQELRFTDTATMAAKKWLAKEEPVSLFPESVRKKLKKWSGQWLHWTSQENDEDERCEDDEWNIIRRKKHQQGLPPTYYALLHLDGDNMGDVFQGDTGKQFGNGIKRFRCVTSKLTNYSFTAVRDIVERHDGELIYAGGDDVLAFLPTETAIECARKLRAAFEASLPGATLSGGIAIVHYKEDLRFALGKVREAEKAAKRIGKAHGNDKVKDALALTICKRSGEHSTVVMGWDETKSLQELVTKFSEGVSDRWTYKLREELETLKYLGLQAGRAETLRLVNRGEFGGKVSKDEFVNVISDLFDAYQKQMQQPTRNWRDADVLEGFVRLVQSASFLARGKD
jgi:CRISPR-associated protein Cmr2